MGTHSPPLTAAPNSDLQRLNAVLDGRQAFHQAQGMLAEMAGCTLRRAGEVLLQHGAQLGLQTADAVAGFFLIHAADAFGDPDSRAAVARFAALASARPNLGRIEDRTTPPFAATVGAGRALEIRGELDIASIPLLAAAFANRQPGTGPESSFLLELHDLTFLDVAGLRALSDVEMQLTDLGERLHVNPPTSAAANWMLRLAVARGWIAPVFTRAAN